MSQIHNVLIRISFECNVVLNSNRHTLNCRIGSNYAMIAILSNSHESLKRDAAMLLDKCTV